MYSANISFIASYLPRQCGIATFTNDLAKSIEMFIPHTKKNDHSIQITAITNILEGYKYPPEVKFEIKEQHLPDYKEAAYYLNLSPAEVINLQHEFGIYGGEDGVNVLTLIENLKKPLISTLHTVTETPTLPQLKIIQQINKYSSHIVVLSKRAIKMLVDIYKIPVHKIKYIPHGTPDVPFLDTSYYKDKFHLTDRKVILTFGLLSPGKGIEDVITALSEVINKFPKITYIILGATHPNIKKYSGESYRNSLENYVKYLSLQENVMFINRFVEYEQLLEFLLMSDIYISPYQNKEQIVSGTLAYALSCGKAIISTPYWFASEILSDGFGTIVPFKSPGSISKALQDLLSNEPKRNAMRKKAYDKGRRMIWSNVASEYLKLFQDARENFRKISFPFTYKEDSTHIPSLPEVNLSHLFTLTDSTGILQHSLFSIPNRNEGYCLDDNARALLVTILNKNLLNDENLARLIPVYLSYLVYAFNNNTGLFRNFMSYNRNWLEDTGSEESNGQALFVLGYIIKNPPNDSILQIANNLFDKTIHNTMNFTSPRAYALIIMGCIFYLSRFSGTRDIKKVFRIFLNRLNELYQLISTKNWKWFEDIVSYNNGRLPQAMIMAGKFLRNKLYTSVGLESLEWLFKIQLSEDKKHLSIIGNDGWYVKGKEKAKYDQQPVEIPALIDACYQAYQVSKNKIWLERISIIFTWFLGNNDRQEMLYDYTTGGCKDALSSSVLNENQGAESTISWLLSLHRMIRIRQDLQIK